MKERKRERERASIVICSLTCPIHSSDSSLIWFWAEFDRCVAFHGDIVCMCICVCIRLHLHTFNLTETRSLSRWPVCQCVYFENICMFSSMCHNLSLTWKLYYVTCMYTYTHTHIHTYKYTHMYTIDKTILIHKRNTHTYTHKYTNPNRI
jgi:hypothetical protein